ncbi:vWA domain-containing protein [Pseudomonas putida]
MAKKALSIRHRPGAGAKPKAGQQQGRRGAARASSGGTVDWAATLLQGRPRHLQDLRWQLRRASAHELWLVIVDASASTRRHQALADAKGLLAELFDQAYRRRARLALLTASGDQPRWQRHGLKASQALQPWLQQLGAGGGTPLVAALAEAGQWLAQRAKAHPQELRRCLVITDGRIKAASVGPLPCPAVLIDVERGAIRLGRGRALADQLGAEYRHIDSVPTAL